MLVALVPVIGGVGGVVLLFAALATGGLAAGAESANEMSYRQQAVPDSAAAVGAIAGGALASAAGEITTIWVISGVFAVAAAIAVLSPVRSART